MRKIMFNDKYGLTAAVLNGTKTQTPTHQRRLEYVERKMKGFWAMHLSCNWCPLPLLAEKYETISREFCVEIYVNGNIHERPEVIKKEK